MEHSMCQLFNAVWSASFSTPLVNFYCLVEYSISPFFTTIWSTPYINVLKPYGVLHTQLNYIVYNALSIFYDHMEHSMFLFLYAVWVLHNQLNRSVSNAILRTTYVFSATWNTPYVSFLVSYGVLHNPLNWSLSIALWQTPCIYFLMPQILIMACTHLHIYALKWTKKLIFYTVQKN